MAARRDLATIQFARIGVEYGWSHVYDLGPTHRVTQEMGLDRSFYPDIPSIYPPPVGWLTAPFTLLPLSPAYYLWVTGELACLLRAWRLAIGGRLHGRALHLTLAAGFIPLVFGICLGQVIFVLVAALVVSWCLLRRGSAIQAGIALSLASGLTRLAELGWLLGMLLVVVRRWTLAGRMGNTWLPGQQGIRP